MPLSREASQMLLRRKIALAVCATAITAPVLSSCGFNYATDQPYDPAAGTNNRDARVDVLAAVVVAGQDDRGTLVAGLANNDDEPISLTSVVGEGLTAEFDPIEVPASGYVNLADEEVHVEGSFAAGDVLNLSLDLDNGESVALEVPVVTNCDEFAGFDTSTGEGAESEDPAYSCEYAEHEGGH
ncbi:MULTISPECIES: hypothetical protein [unclassified Nocardioides]|uniref:hypothetical protein n=1 Tax=unclassified Nocardioides TaxID=2615069 RepID=UPI0030149B64